MVPRRPLVIYVLPNCDGRFLSGFQVCVAAEEIDKMGCKQSGGGYHSREIETQSQQASQRSLAAR